MQREQEFQMTKVVRGVWGGISERLSAEVGGVLVPGRRGGAQGEEGQSHSRTLLV